MKKYISINFNVLLILITLISCESNNINLETNNVNSQTIFYAKLGRYDNEFKIVIIDSCEYLYTCEGTQGQCVFHKGNCKFCINRNNNNY